MGRCRNDEVTAKKKNPPQPLAELWILIEWLRRATRGADLVAENYFNIRLGVNFNQLWFMKSQLK